MTPSIDLRDDENQLLLIGLAAAEATILDETAAAGRLLEKLAGDSAEEFRRFVAEDLVTYATAIVERACAATIANWVEAPPYVEAVCDLLRFSVRHAIIGDGLFTFRDHEDRWEFASIARRGERRVEQLSLPWRDVPASAAVAQREEVANA